jgi:hypothetical protein
MRVLWVALMVVSCGDNAVQPPDAGEPIHRIFDLPRSAVR